MNEYIDYARRNQDIFSQIIRTMNIQNSIIQSNMIQHERDFNRRERDLNRSIFTPRRTLEDTGIFLNFINSVNNNISMNELEENTELMSYQDSSSNEIMCPITHEPFHSDTQVLRIKRCRHIFTPPAIRRWLLLNRICPVCRNDITVDPVPNNSQSDNSQVEEDNSQAQEENSQAQEENSQAQEENSQLLSSQAEETISLNFTF